tara:strand:- start:458 stop:994 length:537 start_codon:yes stop_codon:yes gene_type:complete
MSSAEETAPLLAPAKARRTVGAKRAGAVIVILCVTALAGLVGQTESGGAVLQAVSAATSPARFFSGLGLGGGESAGVADARKARKTASADFAAKEQASLEASDVASSLEATAVAAEAVAVTARDAAVTSRVEAFHKHVDSTRAAENAVSGRTADAVDAAAEAAGELAEAKASHGAAKK